MPGQGLGAVCRVRARRPHRQGRAARRLAQLRVRHVRRLGAPRLLARAESCVARPPQPGHMHRARRLRARAAQHGRCAAERAGGAEQWRDATARARMHEQGELGASCRAQGARRVRASPSLRRSGGGRGHGQGGEARNHVKPRGYPRVDGARCLLRRRRRLLRPRRLAPLRYPRARPRRPAQLASGQDRRAYGHLPRGGRG
mmetsp:Transcript_13719/g.34166  ORF Transcript_13719/g.34166 Transcript_13719/m.34166 type:complete len:201 (-) Transcript_13719:399-1001(-)